MMMVKIHTYGQSYHEAKGIKSLDPLLEYKS